MAYFKLEEITNQGLKHVKTNHVSKGIIVPKTFCKIDVAEMSTFEAKVNRFLLWNLLSHVNLPHILGKDFGVLAVLYNGFAGDNVAGEDQSMNSLLKFEKEDYREDIGTIIGMLAGICTFGNNRDFNDLDEKFINYFKNENVKIYTNETD